MIARWLFVCLLVGVTSAQVPDSAAATMIDSPTVVLQKSPGRAVLLSALIPGGGQVYTGYWWKTLLIAPAEITLGCLAVFDHRAANDALGAGDTTEHVRLRDRRNAFLYFTGAVIAYSMADAYVSARMYGFDRQMQFAIGPTRVGIRVGI